MNGSFVKFIVHLFFYNGHQEVIMKNAERCLPLLKSVTSVYTFIMIYGLGRSFQIVRNKSLSQVFKFWLFQAPERRIIQVMVTG